MMSSSGGVEIKEVLPKHGQLYDEDIPSMILCKPKLMPLKSVTLEKLEKMQRDAEAQVREQDALERAQQLDAFGHKVDKQEEFNSHNVTSDSMGDSNHKDNSGGGGAVDKLTL